MADKSVDIAKKTTADEITIDLGGTSDTGGSSTAGTVMAKENAILEAIENGFAAKLHSALAVYSGYAAINISGRGIAFLWGTYIRSRVKIDGLLLPLTTSAEISTLKIAFDTSFEVTSSMSSNGRYIVLLY